MSDARPHDPSVTSLPRRQPAWQTRARLATAALVTAFGVAGRRVRGRSRQPPCSFRAELVLALLRQRMGAVLRKEPAAVRTREPTVPVPRALLRRLRIERRVLGGVPCEVLTPHTPRTTDAALLYLHGGGYVLCSPATHRALTARLAHEVGLRVVVPDYRLAPEHPHPAALDDALAVVASMLEDGLAPGRLLIAGDSAGGGLTLATLLSRRDADQPCLAGALLLSPWVDLRCDQPSLERHAPHDYLSRPVLETFASHYLAGGTAHTDTPLVSPLRADLGALPPLDLFLGEVETLWDEGQALVDRASEARVDATVTLQPGAYHALPIFASLVPEASAAVGPIAATAIRRLGL